MILIIDNYDSFTYNLNQQINNLGFRTVVFENDKVNIRQISDLNPDKIVISPGPGRPKNSGISTEVVQNFYSQIPILGVCLGHQCIGQIFGSKVVHAKKILHGKTSSIYHIEDNLYETVQNPFKAARYHSLIIDKVPKHFKLTSWTSSNEIMGIKHEKFDLHGIQFHPESFLTDEGTKIMKNFLYESS